MKIDSSLVAIVTGGASGLGEATVRMLRAKGAKVTIADLNQKAGEALVSELNPKETMFFKTDVTDEQSIKELVKKTASTFGRVSAVINCAGVIHAGMFVSKKGVIPTKEIEVAFKINVIGTFNVCKYAALEMSKQEPIDNERGVLINVASVAGFQGQRGQTVYGATKGAIIAMTLPMARDLGKFGIRVMTIAPGVFQTPMAAGMNEKTLEGLRKMTSLGRNGVPHEFAACACAIIENGFASGQTWRLDGGVRLGHL